MDLHYPASLISSPALYRIRIAGRIDPKWADYLHGMTVSPVEEKHGAGATFSELSGLLPDQAALMGVLWQLYSLGASLVSVSCIQERRDMDKAGKR